LNDWVSTDSGRAEESAEGVAMIGGGSADSWIGDEEVRRCRASSANL